MHIRQDWGCEGGGYGQCYIGVKGGDLGFSGSYKLRVGFVSEPSDNKFLGAVVVLQAFCKIHLKLHVGAFKRGGGLVTCRRIRCHVSSKRWTVAGVKG